MSEKIGIYVLGIITGAVLAYLFATGRYEVVNYQTGLLARLDTVTGEVMLCKIGDEYTYVCPVPPKSN